MLFLYDPLDTLQLFFLILNYFHLCFSKNIYLNFFHVDKLQVHFFLLIIININSFLCTVIGYITLYYIQKIISCLNDI